MSKAMTNPGLTWMAPRVAAALLVMGATLQERAEQLEVNPKTIDRLIYRLPAAMKPFERAPQLLRALADDIEHEQSAA